jgi:hypothetical protein
MPKRERVQTRLQTPDALLETQVDTALSGSPQALDAQTRAWAEPKFQHSFANVKVYSDAQDTLNARAFAHGDHLAFSPGQYAPGTFDGDHLIAHELAHVVQARGADSVPSRLSSPGEALETEATRAADTATRPGGGTVNLTQSSAGVVSRSPWDWIPGGDPRNPTPAVQVPEAPGDGVQEGPYYYGNRKDVGSVPGFNFGGGRGHAQVSTQGQDILVDGDQGRAGASYDAEKYEGHAGAWSSQRPDGTSETNYGINLNAKTLSGQGNAAWGMRGGPGGYVHGDVAGPSADLSAYAGDGGFALGAQASVAGFNVGAGMTGTETDEYGKFGLSEGVGAAGRGYWGDTDGDGFREYGVGVDAGPVSVDLRTEDPFRTGVRMAANTALPGIGGLIADRSIDPGNFTERTVNRAGLTTRGANLSTTWDVAKSAGGYVADGAMNAGRALGNAVERTYDRGVNRAVGAGRAVSNAATRAYNYTAGRAAGAGRAVAQGAQNTYNTVKHSAGQAVNTVKSAASSAYDYAAEQGSRALGVAKSAGTTAYNYVAEGASSARQGLSNAADAVSSTASKVWNALPDWDW